MTTCQTLTRDVFETDDEGAADYLRSRGLTVEREDAGCWYVRWPSGRYRFYTRMHLCDFARSVFRRGDL